MNRLDVLPNDLQDMIYKEVHRSRFHRVLIDIHHNFYYKIYLKYNEYVRGFLEKIADGYYYHDEYTDLEDVYKEYIDEYYFGDELKKMYGSILLNDIVKEYCDDDNEIILFS